MAPEQIAGGVPDERSEIFSVGVLAYEILRGKPPYTADSLDELFRQIMNVEPPPLDGVPDPIELIVRRALAKEPAARLDSMRAFRDAIARERKRRFARKAPRWPLFAALALIGVAVSIGVWQWRAHRRPPPAPGDTYVTRALDEYNLFYNDKALSSLRAALRQSPDHPRANAYMLLFGGAPAEDRDAAIAGAKRARTAPRSKDRALVEAALAYAERGAVDAKAALVGAGAVQDRELAFWAAALDWRSANFDAAHKGFQALLAEPAPQFRGRIYDLESSILIYLDEPAEALKIGTMYRDAFPGEADAVAVYATTLAANGRYEEAIVAAEDALRLNEGEDTLAGLAKVHALRGDRGRAKELYQQSIERAGISRRPIRRAALAMLQWADGEVEAAKETVQPCLNGSDAAARERGQCLFVAGVVDQEHAEDIAAKLDALAAEATPTRPSYGFPRSLAALVRARAKFFGGACVVDVPSSAPAIDETAVEVPLDFYGAYHVPFFATWAICERAALRNAKGDRNGAATLLQPIVDRAPNRTWLFKALQRYR
jgi:tetratricopeptide (TPR) repeat protein